MWTDVVIILASYLLGSVPHLAFLAKLRRVRLKGDFHENLWNRAGKALAIIGIIGEFAKGVIPVLVARWLDFGPATVAIAGLAAVCGQMWPVFARFDGEKGNSIAIAMVTALAYQPALVAFVFPIFALIIRTAPRLMGKSVAGEKQVIGGSYSRSLPVGMALFFLSFPFLCWWFNEPLGIIWVTSILFILILVRRLTAGLRDDLKTGSDINTIVFKRLLYDRATAPWRQ